MKVSLNKIIAAAINNQWVKGVKNMVIGYAKTSFVEQMYWLYVQYGQIVTVYLMRS